jgi:hypothetical protein
MSKILPGIYLLRKSKQATRAHVPVLTDSDFPARFLFGTRTFEISRTKAGKLIMTTIDNK